LLIVFTFTAPTSTLEDNTSGNSDLNKGAASKTPHYEIKVKKGDWVEYGITEIFEKAIIPIEFKASFPKVWVSLDKNSRIIVYVLEKRVIEFGNYSREFAIMNATLNGQPIIPFWFFEKITSIRGLPLDGGTPFMPVNESYWNDFRELVKFWANQIAMRGFQATYQVQKCFYRLRVDHLLIGWVEVSASYDNYYGVLKEFSLTFTLTQGFVQEINKKIGTIIVDGESFQFEAGKPYGIKKIAITDTNIPGLLSSVEFGADYGRALNQALERGVIGVLITLKPSPWENETSSRVEALSRGMTVSVSATSDKIKIEVSSVSLDRKILIININHEVFFVEHNDELQVLFDREKIPLANSYGDALNPFDEETPEYFVLVGSSFTQVAISIPHFSTRIIEIMKAPLSIAPYFPYLGIIGGLAILIYLVRRRVRHGNK